MHKCDLLKRLENANQTDSLNENRNKLWKLPSPTSNSPLLSLNLFLFTHTHTPCMWFYLHTIWYLFKLYMWLYVYFLVIILCLIYLVISFFLGEYGGNINAVQFHYSLCHGLHNQKATSGHVSSSRVVLLFLTALLHQYLYTLREAFV